MRNCELRMKTTFISILLGVVLIALSACNDESNFTYYNVDAPYMTSFGFYAADNEGVIENDYAVDLSGNNVSGTSTVSVSVPMPSMVDKSSLVARFSLSDGTTATINGTEQVSQTTANDFTTPVDYILTKNNVHVRYAITVTKATNMKWTETPAFDTYTAYGDPVMRINPLTNEPYIGFKVRTNSNYRPVVAKLEDGAWKVVGGEPFGHKINSSYFDMSFSPTGTLYVGYSDSEASILSGALSVQSFDGTAWNFVGGEGGLLNANSTYVGIAALSDNDLAATQVNSNRKAGFARYGYITSNYKDGQWTSQIPSAVSNNVYRCDVASGSDAAYSISLNRGKVSGVSYGYNVLRYKNGEWTAMLTNYVEQGATQNSYYVCGIYVAPDDTPYILIGDNASGQYGFRIKRYDKSTDTWSTLGGNILPVSFTDSHTEVAVAVAADDTPYVVYTNESDNGFPYYIYFDPDTNQWTDPVKIASVDASGLNIAFTQTGVGYISFADSDNKVRTFKFE